MQVVLFDDKKTWSNLLPLTFTRPVSELRMGILTVREKWERWLDTECCYHCEPYLQHKFKKPTQEQALYINSSILPNAAIVKAIHALKTKEGLFHKNELLAFVGTAKELLSIQEFSQKEFTEPFICIAQVWDVYKKNAEAISADFELLTKGRESQKVSSTVTVIGDPKKIFLESGAKAEACSINTSDGPVYLAADAEIMEGSAVRGPFSLGEHSALKLSTKIYGATTIGPHCKVGGEVNNSVIFGYSNKAHDGFLGNSVIGEWCNLGADSNNSNLKNNYANVKLYNYASKAMQDTGLQFCGLIMGDHSKSGINTMFNTGTVIGVGCNIFGGGFPPTYIPSFSWGGSEGLEEYQIHKLFYTAEKVFERRNLKFSQTEQDILTQVFKHKKEFE